jgi:hypothetical protein
MALFFLFFDLCFIAINHTFQIQKNFMILIFLREKDRFIGYPEEPSEQEAIKDA